MHCVRVVTLASFAVAGAIALAACSSSSNSTGPTNVPPDSVQTEIAQSIATSIQAQVASLTTIGAFSFFAPFVTSPDVNLRQGASTLGSLMRRSHAAGHVRALDFGADCPTVTPSTPADEDGDGVPDLATFTYTTANCNDTETGETITIAGSWTAGDTTVNKPDLDDNEQIQNLAVIESGTQSAFRIAANGGMSIAEITGKVTVNLNFWLAVQETAPQTVYDSVSASGGEEFDFAPSGNPLIEDSQLPAGTLKINLNEAFVTGGQTVYSFVITTPTTLTIDPSCLSTVTGGVVNVTYGTGSTETITWTGCGVYTVAKA